MSGVGGAGVLRWLAFDHPGSPEPVGLLRVLAASGRDGHGAAGEVVEYLDRDGAWHVDPALTPTLLANRAREVPEPEAERIADRLRAAAVGRPGVGGPPVGAEQTGPAR